MFGRLFSIKNGEVSVRLDETMRALLDRVSEELREVLLVNDPEATRRLYPTAYPNDDELNNDYVAVSYTHLTLPTKRIV